jgi:hypothetical protein
MSPPAAAERRLALAAAIVLFASLALFGHRFHWVEEAGSAERDGYVAQAEEILAGRLPRDPFRPPLYPLLTAGLALLVGDPFTAARLISNLSAAALAWLAWATGRRLAGPAAGPAAGAWAFALAAANPNLWTVGQHVTTDMPFAALAAGAILAGLRYLESPRAATAVAAGATLGLAAFVRSNAVFLLPALLAAWWLASPRPSPAGEPLGGAPRRRLGHLAAAGAAFAAALLPHWALRYAAFGDPFYDENWKNLAWKLHGFPDWSYLDRVPYSGAAEVILGDPAAVLRGGFAELARFVSGGAAQLLGTWLHVALFAGGAAWALRRRPRAAGWLLFAMASFVAAVAFSFFTWGRLLLGLLPAACALAFAPWNAAFVGRLGLQRVRVAVAVAGAALVLLLAVKTFAFRLPAFVERHPYAEVAALRRLAADLPPGARLAGTSPFLGRYLPGNGRERYLYVPDAFGPEAAEPGLYFGKLHDLLAGSRAAFLVAGEVDLRDRPRSLLGAEPPVPWLQATDPPPRIAPDRIVADRIAADRIVIWRIDPELANRPP